MNEYSHSCHRDPHWEGAISCWHLVVVVGIMLMQLPVASPAASALPDTIVLVKPSIVGVGTVQRTRRPPGKFIGTGFVVANGRHVITNAHTLPAKLDHKHKEFLAIQTGKGRGKTREAVIVAVDRTHDLSLLRIKGDKLPALVLGDSGAVREGESYAFSGFPIGIVLGMYPVTHRGIISAITPIAIPQLSARRLDAKIIKRLHEPYNVFQLDATAYPGNSGSPLFNPLSGEVVGVINKVFVKETKEKVLEKPSGITYAIPIKYAKDLLKKAGIR